MTSYIGEIPVALLDACEESKCLCGHVALDHAWHGCEACTCNRSGIHAVLVSGVLGTPTAATQVSAAAQPTSSEQAHDDGWPTHSHPGNQGGG